MIRTSSRCFSAPAVDCRTCARSIAATPCDSAHVARVRVSDTHPVPDKSPQLSVEIVHIDFDPQWYRSRNRTPVRDPGTHSRSRTTWIDDSSRDSLRGANARRRSFMDRPRVGHRHQAIVARAPVHLVAAPRAPARHGSNKQVLQNQRPDDRLAAQRPRVVRDATRATATSTPVRRRGQSLARPRARWPHSAVTQTSSQFAPPSGNHELRRHDSWVAIRRQRSRSF